MPDSLLLILLVAGWFVLQRFLLPRLGVRTCMAPPRAPGGPDQKPRDSGLHE